jgi:WD repeat-containing protein 59
MDTNAQQTMKYNAWILAQSLKGQTRSNSWSDSLDEFRINEVNRSLLGDSNRFFYDSLKKAYADILYCYNLLPQRAQVLKFLSIPPAPFGNGVEFITECQICRRTNRGAACLHCKKYLLNCSICQLPVRGASNACLSCGHGGHTVSSINFIKNIQFHNVFSQHQQLHLLEWFRKYEICPTCGCRCLDSNANLFFLN